MSALVPALIASTLLAIATVPITTLSLQSTRTRVSSQLFHKAETLALGVRKDAAEAEELEITGGILELTDTSGSTTSYLLPQGCSVAQSTIATVTCVVNRGSLRQSNTQPLYSHRDLIGNNEGSLSFCYSRYRSENASDRDDRLFTALTTVEEFNSLLEEQGNSEGFLQVHPMSDAGCQQALNNGGTSTPNPSDENDRSGRCTVGNYIGTTYNSDPDDQRWNTRDDGEIKSKNWNSNQKTVRSQDPAPNTSYDCDDDVELEFRA